MNYRNLYLVGSNAFFVACLGLSSCNNNDDPTLGTPSGGTSTGGSSTVGGTSASGGGTNSKTNSNTNATGGKSAAGGTSGETTAEGGDSQGGDGGDGDGSGGDGGGGDGGGGDGGDTTAEGGSDNAGGTSAKGGSSTSTSSAKGGSTSAGGTSAGGTSSTDTATGGTTAAGPVSPDKVSDSDYRFTLKDCGNVVMDVNPKIGARITKLTIGGKGVIVPYTCTSWDGESTSCANNAGSTFWTSPQTDWNWPPVKAIDGGTYTVGAIDSGHLVLTGSADSTLGASVAKDFSADGGTCWITQLYTIKATKSIKVAPWQITRVPRGGIAFFPLGVSSKLAPGPLDSKTTTTTTTPKTVWFDDTGKTIAGGGSDKLIADGAGGWLAYAAGGNLFIKKFTDVEPAEFATGEGDVEIYPGASYLELEVQGPSTSLATNGTLPWTVEWKVVAIPSSVTVETESETLLAFAQAEVAK